MTSSELITVKYAGPASRQVGSLPCHEVRAWWVVRDDSTIGRVKLKAGNELKRHITADHVECIHMDTDTYNSPHMNAMVTFRVLTKAQFAERARLRALVVRSCALCDSTALSSYLRMPDQSEQGVCFTCLRGPELKDAAYTTIAWIKADGRLKI